MQEYIHIYRYIS